jgi:hypothetical protein
MTTPEMIYFYLVVDDQGALLSIFACCGCNGRDVSVAKANAANHPQGGMLVARHGTVALGK